eukprot:scaffold16793_cov45-Phaeocystis_antarctica.AAC.1
MKPGAAGGMGDGGGSGGKGGGRGDGGRNGGGGGEAGGNGVEHITLQPPPVSSVGQSGPPTEGVLE